MQEPNAFLERHLLKSSYALFEILKEKNLIDKVGFKDLGAGGIACASVELAETAGYGAEVDLEQAHISMENLNPSVILCSETQERFMWVVSPEVTPLILEHYNETFALPKVSAGARASVVGKVRDDDRYIVRFYGEKIVDAKAADVVEGIVYDRPYEAPQRQFSEPNFDEPTDYNAILLQLLSHQNIACRKPVYENYDKQVQGRVKIERGMSDAGLLQPFNEPKYPHEIQATGVALALAQNPYYCQIDPYWGTVNALSLTLQRLAAVGTSPQAITDCLCFGNPEKPAQLWDFIESVRALKESCATYRLREYPDAGIPIVAGNVSFYNESKQGAIPASPMIAAVGVTSDVATSIDAAFQKPGNVILLVGERQDQCGGSAYYQLSKTLGANIPKPDMQQVSDQVNALLNAIEKSLIVSAKAIADGGLATAVALMTVRHQVGAAIEFDSDLRLDKALFSETPGFILEVAQKDVAAVQALFAENKVKIDLIGETVSKGLSIQNKIKLDLNELKHTWCDGLRKQLL